LAEFKVDGSAVIGVDEAKVPKFGSLVEVGDTGAGQFKEGLAEGVGDTVEGDALLEGEEGVKEVLTCTGVEDAVDKGEERFFVSLVGVKPGGDLFGFADGFEHIVFEAGREVVVVEAAEGLCAEEGLVEEVFVVGGGPALVVVRSLVFLV